MPRPVEYEFVLPNNEKRYEIVYDIKEVQKFKEMHGAISANPVRRGEK